MVHADATAAKFVPHLPNYLQKCKRLSVCKLLPGQDKKDRNVLSKAHKSENPVKVVQDHWHSGDWGWIRGNVESITKWELQKCLQQ